MIRPAVERPLLCSMSTVLRIALLLTFCNPGVARINDNYTRQGFCPQGARFDLSNVTRNDSGFFIESGDFFTKEAAKIIDGELRGCICDLKPCLALCPSEEKNARNYAAIPRIYTTNLTIDDVADAFSPEEWFHIFFWIPCPGKYVSYPLEPMKYPEDEFYLLNNGSLFLPRAENFIARFLDLGVYCLHLNPGNTSYTPRVCTLFRDDDFLILLDEFKKNFDLVSVLFIIATVIVYSVLPELRNIHGTTLRCYLYCLAIEKVAQIALEISGIEVGSWCLFLGFTTYFSFISSFLWQNVMCFDLWWRLRGYGSIRSGGVQHDRKKFRWYSLYSWGVSAIMTAICIVMELYPSIPESLIRPGFSTGGCWFKTYKSSALYQFIPQGLITFCNICLFVSTSIKIFRHEKDTKRAFYSKDSIRHTHNKQRFGLHLKLFVVMGVFWFTDILFWLWVGPEYFWLDFSLVAGTVNSLHGTSLFFIFICKKNIWLSLKERYGWKKLRATCCQ